jgi:hypothetical protein
VENINRMKEDILFLVADNTNTNPATADLLDVPFIGCASHRFNLAVQKYLEQHQNVITNIHRIMVLLSNLKKAGKLRQFTDLEPYCYYECNQMDIQIRNDRKIFSTRRIY